MSFERGIYILFYLMALLVIIVDQITKLLVRANLRVGEKLEAWQGVLNLTHYQNSGAAFGIFQGYGRLFVPVAIIVSIICVYILETGKVNGKLIEIGMALFVGGAIGNAIDRTLFNQVTDFIHFQFGKGILNIADYALVFGMVIILMDSLITRRYL